VDENESLGQLAVDQTPQQWLVSTVDDGRRLDVFLSARLPQFTRREVIEEIAAGRARINGHVSAKGSPVRPGDTVTLTSPLTFFPNPHLPIQILWADDALVVLGKPSGIPSVALRHSETATVANFLLAHFPEAITASPRVLEAGIVHRLDTATSGVLLAARTTQTYRVLREQFAKQIVQKQYLALVHGQASRPGTRRSLLAPAGRRGQRMHELTTSNGQEAHTAYVPVSHFSNHTLIRVTIYTGVRHQIRVHLAALGYPIVGDAVYGPPGENTRLCLHAETLSFLHPHTGAREHFTCPLPEDFQAAIRQVTGMVTPNC
jgi:23S rRNA pseudouridine1911/1915/1917 synthase